MEDYKKLCRELSEENINLDNEVIHQLRRNAKLKEENKRLKEEFNKTKMSLLLEIEGLKEQVNDLEMEITQQEEWERFMSEQERDWY